MWCALPAGNHPLLVSVRNSGNYQLIPHREGDRRRVMRASRIDTLFGTDLFHFEVVALRDIGSLLFTLNLFKGKKKRARVVTRRKPGMKKAALSLRTDPGRDGTVTGNEAGSPFKYP